MDRGAWLATVHGVTRSQRRLSDFTFTFIAPRWASQVVLVVKNLPVNAGDVRDTGSIMAVHSSILAWRISWTEEPGGLQSMGLQRVGHD